MDSTGFSERHGRLPERVVLYINDQKATSHSDGATLAAEHMLTQSLLVPGWWLTNRAQHRQHWPVHQNVDLPETGGRLLLLPLNGSCYC